MTGAAVVEFIKEWGAIGGGAVALIAIVAGKDSLGALGRWRDGVLKAVFYPFAGEQRARARAEKTEKLVEAILVELKTNGGSSLKDAINRIEDRQVRMDGRIDWMLTLDNAAMFEADHEGLCIWVSLAYQALTGRPAAEVLGWGWIAAVHDEDIDRIRLGWKSAVEEQRAFSMRFRIVRLDGAVIPVHSTAHPLHAGPRVIGWAGMVTVEETAS